MIRLFFRLSLLLAATVQAQGINYNLGRTPSSSEIQAMDFAIRPDGMELPAGAGNARAGAQLYALKCIGCHGADASGAGAPRLVGKNTVVSNWPFATSLWDYINRAMPLNMEGSLTHDDVYALTAYLLYKGGVIGEEDELTKANLADVPMPNRDGYVEPPLSQWEPGMKRIFRVVDP